MLNRAKNTNKVMKKFIISPLYSTYANGIKSNNLKKLPTVRVIKAIVKKIRTLFNFPQNLVIKLIAMANIITPNIKFKSVNIFHNSNSKNAILSLF